MRIENFRNNVKLLSAGVLLIAMTGCATKYGAAEFRSEPDGVQVFDMEDGSVIGVTPVRYLWRSKETNRKFMNVRMQKDGYRDVVKSFWLNLDHGSKGDAIKNPQAVQFTLTESQ